MDTVVTTVAAAFIIAAGGAAYKDSALYVKLGAMLISIAGVATFTMLIWDAGVLTGLNQQLHSPNPDIKVMIASTDDSLIPMKFVYWGFACTMYFVATWGFANYVKQHRAREAAAAGRATMP